MKQIALVESPVEFIENRAEGLHSYLLGMTELTGVTTILKEVIFRDKYSGIDEDVLRNAANRGTAIHIGIQGWMTENVDVRLPEDLTQYHMDVIDALNAWRSNSELVSRRAIAVEYLVSDCKTVATQVDVVEPDGEGVSLGDIKTTSTLDEEYLSWQLSIERWLTQRQNPGLKVTRLLAYWYNRQRKEWTVRQIPDKGDIEVERLLAAWIAGDFWGMPMPKDASVPAPVMSIAEWYADMEGQIKQLTAKRDEFRDRLLAAMQEHGITQIKTDGFTCSLVGASERRSVDTKRMQSEHPELAELFRQYEKVAQIKESIKIVLK